MLKPGIPFFAYGIHFQPLRSHLLELVRNWRNQDFVRLNMRFQKLITPQEQKAWYDQLHPVLDQYFVCYQNGQPFGLWHVKMIEPSKLEGESGGFVGAQKLVNGLLPAFAILGLMDYAFLELGLGSLLARYHPEKKSVVSLNHQLGYRPFDKDELGFLLARVTREDYLRQTEKLREAAKKVQLLSFPDSRDNSRD